jgi:hypothetical protein
VRVFVVCWEKGSTPSTHSCLTYGGIVTANASSTMRAITQHNTAYTACTAQRGTLALAADDTYGGILSANASSTMRVITCIGSSFAGVLNGLRPVRRTYCTEWL